MEIFTSNSSINYTFNYVYNYTDHLGNIRLSYSQDPSTNVLKIIEENHYYPFGLKHTGYNSDKMMLVKEASVLKIKPMPPLFKTSYNYKYQGQERQDELGLNWYSYKWRNVDPAIGRFMSIDPLTEEYEDYTPYQFSSNQPIHAPELEGLESAKDLNKTKNNIDTGSVRYKVAEFLTSMVMAMGDLGAASKGQTTNTPEEKASYAADGFLFIVDNSLFIEGVMSINRAPSDGEFSPNYAKGTTEVATKSETGLIYKVPGEATKSGKPYIGKTTKSSPAERGRGATDGRDRTKATVIDRYDAKKSKEGSFKEQRAINNNGGVKNLDNKRNEMSKKNYEAYKELQKKKSGG
jgi:RHS repeat-associated protein